MLPPKEEVEEEMKETEKYMFEIMDEGIEGMKEEKLEPRVDAQEHDYLKIAD